MVIWKRHSDLINSLPIGAQKRMTEIIDASLWHINKVLNGEKNPETELNSAIIVLAGQMARREKLKQNGAAEAGVQG